MRRLIALLLFVLLTACASRPVREPGIALPPLRLAPSALGQEVALQQRLVFRFGTQVRELDALLEVDARDVRLAVQAMGRTGVTLQWDGEQLSEQRAAWLPAAVRGERVLDDVQFSLWPADAVRAALPPGWTLSDNGGTRELLHAGRTWLVRERVNATTLQVRNVADGYDLTIESVAGGDVLP
ncbi:DUF3261 domain-containing protein [Pseudoxanthomonas sp. Root630]|uniref:DUF3261 domain-containing protein n=1 Tax=Pseudoxanthomonas sp. Root630 TaxID=1736574 RepID=UPI000702CEEF|nr:DUF3261 domain-containing protein [Pseudoxanthomonas sp. Root630]KRA50618.1 hypothetical protein ASD72_18210 [Pseudoxanthomonas sp. Root630]